MAGPLSRWTLIYNQGTSWNYDQTSLSSWAKLRMILVMSRVLWVSSSSHTSSTVLQDWNVPLHESNSFTFFLLTTRTALEIPVMLIFQRRVDASTQQRPHHLDLGFHREISEPRHQNEQIKAWNFISLPQWSSLPDFVWLNASKQRWSISQTPCQVQTIKQTKVNIEDLATEHSQTRRKEKTKKQRNKIKVILKHLAMSKQ